MHNFLNRNKFQKGTFSVKHVDIDQLFDKAEKELTEAALEVFCSFIGNN